MYTGCETLYQKAFRAIAALLRNFQLDELHMNLRFASTLAAGFLAVLPAVAQAPALANVNTQLRAEETKDSQLMWWLHEVTDVYGPRLTGSPNMAKANEWTRDEFAKWGLANPHLEAWGPFGRGWAYQFCEVRMISPDTAEFLALPEAWTPGTNGALRGEVTQVIASSAADLEKYRGKMGGKIVLFGEARMPPPDFSP